MFIFFWDTLLYIGSVSIFKKVTTITNIYKQIFFDGFIFADNLNDADQILNELQKLFDVKIGEADIFLGIQIVRDRAKKSIFLHQEAYINRLVQKFKVLDVPCNILADPNTILSALKNKCVLNVPYREVIGSLMFFINLNRPDLAFIVVLLIRYVNNFDKSHWRA